MHRLLRMGWWLTWSLGMYGQSIGSTSAAGPVTEIRAIWVDAFHPGIKSANEVTQLLQTARTAGANTLFVQVLNNGAAYYRSTLIPRAVDGRTNSDASYDPLAELLRQARDPAAGRRIEIHAWINTFPVWSRRDAPPGAGHVWRQHPDWLTRHYRGTNFGSSYVLDPGHPDVQDHLVAVARELLERYEIDGLQLDYFRYPDDQLNNSDRGWGYNPVAVSRFRRLENRKWRPAPNDPAWGQFRREQVTAVLRRIALEASVVRPEARLSVATIAYGNGDYPIIWENTAAYSHVFQDWHHWLRQGLLDTAVPMLYFDARSERRDWDGWTSFLKTNRTSRQVVAGLAAYRNPIDLSVALARNAQERLGQFPGLDGVAFFSYASNAVDRPGGAFFAALGAAGDAGTGPLWNGVADVPAMPWKTNQTRARLLSRAGRESPLDGARVELKGPVVRSLTADANGWFGVLDLVPGDYVIRARAFDAEPLRWVGRVMTQAGVTAQPVLLAADADADGDGSSNGDEITAGTDPDNADSRLRVEVDVLSDRYQVQARPTAPGRRYWLEIADAAEGPWTELTESGSLDGSEASTGLHSAGAYFRVRVTY